MASTASTRVTKGNSLWSTGARFLKAAVLLLVASSSMSDIQRNNFVQAASTGGKVVRVELQKHWIPHVEFEDLEESEEDNGQIHIEEMSTDNFAQLRET